MKTAHFQNRSGFTLIELMVAIAIIAIVSVIGTALFGQAQKNARDGRRINEIGEIQNALEQYYATNNGYPALAAINGSSNISALTVLNGYFSNNIPPSDPNTGEVSSYQYTYYGCNAANTLATSYIICARLVNPTGKANVDTAPTTGCGALGTSSAPILYCKKSISN